MVDGTQPAAMPSLVPLSPASYRSMICWSVKASLTVGRPPGARIAVPLARTMLRTVVPLHPAQYPIRSLSMPLA